MKKYHTSSGDDLGCTSIEWGFVFSYHFLTAHKDGKISNTLYYNFISI